METLKIKRNINGTDVEIALTMAEMYAARERTELINCMDELECLFPDAQIPEEELLEYAEAMVEYMTNNYRSYSDSPYTEARDAICEDYELYDKYEANEDA